MSLAQAVFPGSPKSPGDARSSQTRLDTDPAAVTLGAAGLHSV